MDALTAISPIDGRYADKCAELRDIFSEYGLIRRRVLVECTWLRALAADPRIAECRLTAAQAKAVAAGGWAWTTARTLGSSW